MLWDVRRSYRKAYHVISASSLSLYWSFLVFGQCSEISESAASSSPVAASPVSHAETTPKKRKRVCTDCSETYFKGDWCSTYHWDSNTGYCRNCTRQCHVCHEICLSATMELLGTNYYCNMCLDEEFICARTECGRKYRRRDGQFDWRHLRELQDATTKRKAVFCKKCRDSKK